MSSSTGTQGHMPMSIPIMFCSKTTPIITATATATATAGTATATRTAPTTSWSRFSVSSVFTMKPRKCGSCG
jgi:hypothetical protein